MSEQKSIFEMTAEEFHVHVAPRATEIAKHRWYNGLSMTIPAGEGFEPNQFLRIYRDKPIELTTIIDNKYCILALEDELQKDLSYLRERLRRTLGDTKKPLI